MPKKSLASKKAKDGGESNNENRKRPRKNYQSETTHGKETTCENREEVANNNDGSREVSVPMRPSLNKDNFLSLTDPDVLDCSICYELLTIPVYQCENGHVACSSCCTKVLKKCPSCCSSIGYSRNRAIEKVIESVEVKCQNNEYGCPTTMSYSKMFEHLKTCLCAPCSCPSPECNYKNVWYMLMDHFFCDHKGSTVPFSFNSVLQVTLNANEKFIVLQEEKGHDLIILSNATSNLGTVLFLCLISYPGKMGLFYDMMARSKTGYIRFQSHTKIIQKIDDNSLPEEYLVVPPNFIDSTGRLQLDICIWESLVSPPSFQLSN